MTPRTASSDPHEVLAEDHPLWRLDGRSLGRFRLRLVEAGQLPSSGWKGFRLDLVADDARGRPHLLDGIHSVGGKGISPWFDVDYRPVIEMHGPDDAGRAGGGSDTGGEDGGAHESIDLRRADLELPLFRILEELVPAHGHLAIAYERPEHRETHQGLKQGVPPVATPLGWSAWQAGFDGGFKDWHISEGGHEGPKKLQCNVPIHEEHRRRAAEEAADACRAFLDKLERRENEGADGETRSLDDSDGLPRFWERTRRRVRAVLDTLEGA